MNNLDIKNFTNNFFIEICNPNIKSTLLPDGKRDDIDKEAIMKYWKQNYISNDKVSIKSGSSSGKYESQNKLVYSKSMIKESIVDINDDPKSKEKINELAKDMNAYLYQIFDNNYDENSNTINKNNLVYQIWKFIINFNKIKEKFKDIDIKIWENYNIELVYQIYRHANRNEFQTESIIIKYVFGFFYIISYYLEIPTYFFEPVKKWISYLINKK